VNRRRTGLDDVVPPLGLADDVDEVVGRHPSLQDRATAADMVERDGRPRRHVADDDHQYTTQILEQVLVADLDSVSLPRLEFGKNTAHGTRTIPHCNTLQHCQSLFPPTPPAHVK